MTPVQFAQKAKQAGYAWAALEHDDYNNSERWGPFQHACRAEGVFPGVWFTEGGAITQTPSDSHFAIAELEGQGDYDGIINAINANALPACPKAVLTNFNVPLTDSNGLAQPGAAAPLINAGFACLTESYVNENPNATPDNMNVMALNCGWPKSQPVFGVYPVGGQVPSYAQWMGWSGWSAYLAEYLPL